MVRDYSRRQFIAGCCCAGAGALAAGATAATTGERGRVVQPATRWNVTYESGGNAEINAHVPAVDDDGFVLAGATGDTGEDEEADRAAWLVKVDAAGRAVWERTYTRQTVTVANDVVATDDGYLLAGNTSGGPDGGQDGFGVRVDAEGDEQWAKTFWNMPDADDAVNAAVERPDGGFAVAGETSRFERAWLAGLRSDGTVDGNGTIGGGNDARFNDIVRHQDGGYIVVGSGDNNSDDRQGWVTRINESYEQVWATSLYFRRQSDDATNPYNDYNAFYDVSHDDGGFVAVGASAYDADDPARDGWILKINRNGDKQWDRLVTADRYTELSEIIWDGDKLEYFAVGQTATNGDGVDQRGFVANVGLTGSTHWTNAYGATDAEASRFSGVYRADDEGVVCVGSAASSVGANRNGWSVKIGGDAVATPTPTRTATGTPTPTAFPTTSASPSPSAVPPDGGTRTATSTPPPTSTAPPTTEGDGGDAGGGIGGTTTTAPRGGGSDSGLPLTMIGVGIAIVALAGGGFLYNRFGGGDGDGGEDVAGPGAGTGGAATLTGGLGDDGTGADSDSGGDADPGADADSGADDVDGGTEPTPASDVVNDEDLERAQTVVEKSDSGTEAADDASDGAESSTDDGGSSADGAEDGGSSADGDDESTED